MNRKKYLNLRTELYQVIGELGTIAENNENEYTTRSYSSCCDALDEFDQWGISLGYLDEDTLCETEEDVTINN